MGEVHQDKEEQALSYGNLGNVYMTREETEEAEELYKKSLKLSEELALEVSSSDIVYTDRTQTKVTIHTPSRDSDSQNENSSSYYQDGREVAGGVNGYFYYFDPDSLQSNLTRLKHEMEHFLEKNDFYINFRIFAGYQDFHRELAINTPEFVFLPEWYFRKNKKHLGLIPLLQPVRNGQTTYRKILLTSQDSTLTLKKLHNKTLAMSMREGDMAKLLDTLILLVMTAT